ncbi:carbohydrate porin [Escherichia coli]|uniref:carbohydrate porin n=1 Tax=Escherichia coli TaxID=562 RepID=UPI0020407703|nr:carbohydrate porin [Escherichia coli]
MIVPGANSESVNERWDLNGRILLGFDGTRKALIMVISLDFQHNHWRICTVQ